MPPEDEVLPAEEQPLHAAASPTIDSSGYVPESDPKEDPKEDDEEDPDEDPADYPVDGGDDSDDEDESFDDDEDDDVDIEWDEKEEEHPAPADSTAIALLAVDQAPSVKETEPFKTDEGCQTPAIPSPPPLPFSPWSSPLPYIPSPPLPLILSPLPVSSPPPASPTYPLGYRAAMIRLRAKASSTSHSPLPHIILSHTRADTPPSGTPPLLPILLPTSLPSLLLPSADHGADRLEVEESSSAAATRPTGGFRTDYGFVATIDREIRHDLERDVGYRITNTWDEILVDMQDINEIYVRLDDEQTERQLMASRLHMLYRDMREHARTALLMEKEARKSQEAWGRSMDASDLARSEVMSLRTTILGQ
ncbi:hypothetical protein Tco_0038680 [Tanacetum coccineum]